MLTQDRILEVLKIFQSKYGIDPDDIVLVAGAALVMHGLRETAADVDLYVNRETCLRLKATGDFRGSNHKLKDDAIRLVNDILDIGDTWFPHIVGEHGYRVQTLQSLLSMKQAMNRLKDQPDIRLLERAMGHRRVSV